MDDAIRVGVVSYGLDPAKNNIKRPETALESVISRLSAITSRVQSSVHRADSAAKPAFCEAYLNHDPLS